MPSFDLDQYFARRMGTSVEGKIDALNLASEEKVAALTQYRNDLAEKQKQQENTWVAKLGLIPGSGEANAVNLAASLYSGTARLAGQLGALRNNFEAIADESLLSNADVAAYNRYQQGKASPEDVALLGQVRTRGNVSAANPGKTALELFKRAGQSRHEATDLTKAFDQNVVVDQTARQQLNDDLGKNFDAQWGQVKEGATKMGRKGEFLSGIGDTVTGLGKLLFSAGDAIVNNKQAALEYIVENAPQVAVGAAGGGVGRALLTASNVGYAADYYSQGIEAYQAKHGTLPEGEERQKLALYAASLALAEQAGELSILAPLKKLRGVDDAAEASVTAARKGRKDAFAEIGKDTVKATASEAATEGYQTYAEGEVLGQPASAKDIYTGAVIGGVAGGGLSGGISTLAHGSQSGASAVDALVEQAKAREEVAKAVEAGDVTPYLDPKAKTYDPARAIQVLHGINQQEGTTPEARDANLKQASQVVNDLEAQKTKIQGRLDMLDSSALKQQLAEVQAQRAKVDPSNTEVAGTLDQMASLIQDDITLLESEQADPKKAEATTNTRKKLQEQLDQVDRHLTTSRTRLDEMGSEFTPKLGDIDVEAEVAAADSADTAVAQPAAEKVINLAMRSPQEVKPEHALQLADNPDNGLSDEQRTYLRQFSEARLEENKLMTIGKVAQRVLDGSPDGRDIGLRQYQQRFAKALAIGDKAAAALQLSMLNRFAAIHASKADFARQAIAKQGLGAQMIKVGAAWQTPATRLSDKEIKQQRGFTLNSGRLVAEFQQEAKTLASGAAAMQAAYELHTNKAAAPPVAPTTAPVQSTPSSTAVDSQSTEAAPAAATTQSNTVEGQTQSNVNTTVNSVEGVNAATPVASEQQAPAPTSTEAQAAPAQAEDQQQWIERALKTDSKTLGSQLQKASKAQLDKIADALEQYAKRDDLDVEQLRQVARVEDVVFSALDQVEETQSESPEAKTQSSEEVQSTQEAETRGTLDTVNQPATEGKPYQQRNLIRDFFRQSEGGINGTQRPLAAVKNFLSQWAEDGSILTRFLKLPEQGLSEKQQELLKEFPNVVTEFRPVFLANLVQAKNAEFRFKDLMTFFVEQGPDGKPVTEENFLTAMSYALFSWVAENASRLSINEDAEINAILGRDEDTLVSDTERRKLGTIGARQNIVVNALGQRAVQALGLKAVKGAPMDLQPRLEATIGAHIMKALLDTEVLVREELSKAEMGELMGKTEEESSPGQFIRFNRNEQGLVIGTTAQIQELAKGTQGILDKLFSVEPGIKMPSLEPVPYTQATTKNTQSAVPKRLQEILAEKNAEANYLRQDMWHLLDNLDVDAVMAMMGAESTSETTTHVSRRQNNQAKNDALLREYDHFREFVEGTLMPSKKGLESPFYFEHTAWRQQRVGIATNGVNPQTSKLHRFLMFRQSWKTQVDTTDAAQMDNFKLRVMEGLGVKTDKQSNAKSLAGFDAMFDPSLNTDEKAHQKAEARSKAVDVLVQVAIEGRAMSPEMQADLMAGVKAGGEKFHSLDALMAMAHYRSRGEATAFTVQMMGEVDGVTNGPMLSHLLMGAAKSAKDLFGLLNRGGFFEQGNTHNQYNVWREAANHLDLYEMTSSHMMDAVNELGRTNAGLRPALAAIFGITGDLRDTAGKVTKEGRNIIKTPLTAMVFGSSLSRAVESMAENFVETVIDRFEASVSMSDTQRKQLIQQVNTLLPQGAQIPVNNTAQQLLNYQFSRIQEAALQNAFTMTVGEAVKQTMKKDFDAFMSQRTQLNQAAQLAFELYNSVYTALRTQFIEELVVRENAQPGTGLAHGKDGKPYHDLNAEQERELRKRVASFLPVMHTLMSKDSGSLASGLLMSKTQRKFSTDSAYRSEVHFGDKFRDNGARSTLANSYTIAAANPGVGTAVMGIHATDSAISHYAAEGNEVLNIHDAHGAGLGIFEQTARNLNQATWNAMLNYSPAGEVSGALNRVVQGLAKFLGQDNVPEPVLKAVAQAVSQFAKKNRIEDPKLVLDDIVAQTKEMAYHADSVKLDVLSELASVDQYALEGGNYAVTDADRASAQAKKTGLTAHLDQATVDSLTAISAKLLPFLGKQGVQAAVREDVDTRTGLENLSAVQGLQLLDHEIQAADTSTQLRERLEQVRQVLVAKQVSLSDALNQVMGSFREGLNRSRVIQALAARWQSIPANLWGDRGTPTIESDPELVALFERRGEVTAQEALQALKQKFTQNGNPRLVEFNQRILAVLAKTLDPGLKLKYVTPALAESQVLDRGANRARGWYVSTGTQQEIYVLSPDYKYSGITAELVLHELVHAALAGVIDSPQGDAQALVAELETLMAKAKTYITDKGLTQYSEAVANVQELVAWGMSNLGFQKDVLNQINMESKTWGNQLVSGMQSFIGAIVRLLFKDVDQRRNEVAQNGMALLISNVSGLFNAAAQQKTQVETVLNQQGPDPVHTMQGLTTKQLFDALVNANPQTWAHPDTMVYLRDDLLGGIVQALHGPWGSFKTLAEQNLGLSALDMLQKSKDEGWMPFASKVLASPLVTPEPAAFVIEQVEATVRAALADNESHTSFAYSELAKLFVEVRGLIKAADFHDGDWATATPAEKQLAQEQHDFVFGIESQADGKSDYLARFAAMGLAHPKVRELLGVATKRNTRTLTDGKGFIERLQILFDNILAFFTERMTHTYQGQQADEKLSTLVNQLVDIEVRKKRKLARDEASLLASAEDNVKAFSEGVRKKVAEAANASWLRQSRFPVVRAASGLVSVIAKDQVEQLMKTLQEIQDQHSKGLPGMLNSIVHDLHSPKEVFQVLLQMRKKAEKQRKFLIVQTAEVALKAFKNEGKDLKDADKAAISAVFLRTDMAALLNDYGMEGLQGLLIGRQKLHDEIQKQENLLAQFSAYQHFYSKSAKLLAYYKATGMVRGEHVLMNAHNIAHLAGTPQMGRVDATIAQNAEAILDKLVSLRALQYTGTAYKTRAQQVLASEMARTDGGNGIEMVLRTHRDLQQKAKEQLFQGQEALRMKGYTPEIYNPHTELVVANTLDGKALEEQGYVKGSPVKTDPADPDMEAKHIYVLKDGGLGRYLSGTLSLTSQAAKGSTKHNGNLNLNSPEGYANALNQAQITTSKQAGIRAMFQADPNFDPANESRTFLAPVLNPDGAVVNYRYLMQESMKDALLDRDNRFDKLLGTMAGSTFDKVTSPDDNRKVIQALRDQYKAEYAKRPNAFLTVSLTESDPEMRDIYRMLPESTRKVVREIWGRDELVVPKNQMDLIFGYRKLSVGDVFERVTEDREAQAQGHSARQGVQARAERAFVQATEWALLQTGIFMNAQRRVRGIPLQDADQYARQARTILRRGERMWQEAVAEMKDLIVVKTGTVMIGNILSNVSLLAMYGVGFPEMAKHHRVALKATLAYQRDERRLHTLNTQLDAGYLLGNEAELRHEKARLEDAMSRNPVRELIDAGLMPTIVEDLAADEDIYSYKSRFTRTVDKVTSKLHPGVLAAGRLAYMTHDTKMYRGLSHATQVSDFVARYTLYQHLTQRKSDPMDKKAAIHEVTEAFVNYDVPMHRGLQYMDDTGITMFTKYFLRIQRVLIKMMREHPARELAMMALGHYWQALPIVMDSSFIHHLGNNPFGWGALRFPSTLDQLATVQAGVRLLK